MKLNVELIPKTAFRSNLRSELPREEWDVLRKACYSKAGHKCEVCGGVGPKHPVEAHEIWQWEEHVGIQRLIGLIALCPDCHMAKHIGFAEIKGKLEHTKQHIREVNDWTEYELQKHLDLVWNDWFRRSNLQWTMDLKALEKDT